MDKLTTQPDEFKPLKEHKIIYKAIADKCSSFADQKQLLHDLKTAWDVSDQLFYHKIHGRQRISALEFIVAVNLLGINIKDKEFEKI